MAKHTTDQINEVCRLIDKKVYSPAEISKMTGVSLRTIKGIREGNIWKQISMKYMMPYCIYDDIGKFIGVNDVMTNKCHARIDEYRKKLVAPLSGNKVIDLNDFYS